MCVCVICMKYRIIALIIIIISLGQKLISCFANTSHTLTHTHAHALTHTHTHTRARAHTHRRRRSGCRCSMGRGSPTVPQLTPLFEVSPAIDGLSLVQSNKQWRRRHGFREFLGVFRVYKKILDRTETRTRESIMFVKLCVVHVC